MNILFKIDGTVITPPSGDTILAGITKDSLLKLLASWGIPTAEEHLTIGAHPTPLRSRYVGGVVSHFISWDRPAIFPDYSDGGR